VLFIFIVKRIRVTIRNHCVEGFAMKKYIKIIIKTHSSIIVITLATMVLIMSILMSTMSIKSLLGLSDELANAVASIIGGLVVAILSGALAMITANHASTKQIDLQFINEFPSKIRYLDEILDNLVEFSKKINKDNSHLLYLDENFIRGLFDLGTQVDATTYFRLRQSHLSIQRIINEMFHGKNKLFFLDRDERYQIMVGRENDLENCLTRLNQHIEELTNYLETLRETFIQHYNEKVKNSIYKPV
jgi:hypothetical protein